MAEIPTAVEAELARLRAKNARLLRLLKLTPRQAAPPGPAQAAYFEAQPGPVHDGSPPEAKVAFYGALFAARPDVYALRFDNARTGKGGWVPAVRGGWRKGARHEDRDYFPLTPTVLTVQPSPGRRDRQPNRRPAVQASQEERCDPVPGPGDPGAAQGPVGVPVHPRPDEPAGAEACRRPCREGRGHI